MNNSNLFGVKQLFQIFRNLLTMAPVFFLQKKIISDKFLSTMLNYHYYVSLAQ